MRPGVTPLFHTPVGSSTVSSSVKSSLFCGDFLLWDEVDRKEDHHVLILLHVVKEKGFPYLNRSWTPIKRVIPLFLTLFPPLNCLYNVGIYGTVSRTSSVESRVPQSHRSCLKLNRTDEGRQTKRAYEKTLWFSIRLPVIIFYPSSSSLTDPTEVTGGFYYPLDICRKEQMVTTRLRRCDQDILVLCTQ